MDFTVKTVGIVGAGQMGTGIAEVFLKHSYTVFLYDHSVTALQLAQEKINIFFTKHKAELKLVSVEDICKRIHLIQNISQLTACDLVIEAASENFSLKSTLLQEISAVLPSHILIVTNTSSLSLNQLSSFVTTPERFMGMHFMNPVPVIPLVELIKSTQTSDETVQTITNLVHIIEKTAVHSKDSPGFIVNRILIPMIHEAIILLEAEVGSAQDIDTAMRLGTNQPIGPLALADLIGLDTCLAIMQTLEKELNSNKYKPCTLLSSMVNKNLLGRKTKKGFYEY